MSLMKCGLVFLSIISSIIFGISPEIAQAKDGDLDRLIAHVSPPPPPQKKLYTAYNMRHSRGVVSTVNYQVSHLLPAGTEIKKIVFSDGFSGKWVANLDRQKVEKDFVDSREASGKIVKFTTVDGEEYRLDFKKRHNPESSIWSFATRMFTETPPSKIFDGMNEQDVAAIKSGQVLAGMTMDQVVMSMGIPPEHKTPDAMNKLTWLYWTNRTTTKGICFDLEKKATRCNAIPEGQRAPL